MDQNQVDQLVSQQYPSMPQKEALLELLSAISQRYTVLLREEGGEEQAPEYYVDTAMDDLRTKLDQQQTQ